ncbi:YihY/virulence factor BrkB family protein [Rubritalea spongiae]|uniref:YihY/virulence factor BrkB family protein n=1 Tax=Rubritalea spongiae TaxID=430797 RepID=A0ABW5E1C1_9BACT
MRQFRDILLVWGRRFTTAGYYWWKSKHANEAAALAFYSLFSLIPMLLIGLFVASWIVGKDIATQSLLEQTNKMTGFSTSDYLKQALTSDLNWVDSKYPPLIGGLVLAFSATKVVSELRRALSNIFGNPQYEKKRQAALSILIGRAISLMVILALGLALALSVMLTSILNQLTALFTETPYIHILIQFLSPFTTIAGTLFLGTIVMRWLPKRPPGLKEAFLGSIVFSSLLVLLKYGLTIFLQHANISNVFGGALTLVLLLLWIYFVMQVILYSAEFTAILVRERLEKNSEDTTDETEYTDPIPE